MKGRYDEARAVLKRIHGSLHQDNTFFEREFHQIKAQIELDKEEKLGIKDIFTKPSYRKRVLLVMNFFAFQQLTGIIPLQNYQVVIYQICGFSAVMSLILIGIWGTVVCIAVACMSPWFDRIGRRASVFLAYSFIIPGALLIVIMWARFEAGGSTDTGVAKGIVFGMFFLVWGYGGVLNTFAPCVSIFLLPQATLESGQLTQSATVLFGDYANMHPRSRRSLRLRDIQLRRDLTCANHAVGD